MAKDKRRDRVTVDLGDDRERIEKLWDDRAWEALPLSGKVLVLVRERLDQAESEQEEMTAAEKLETIREYIEQLAKGEEPSGRLISLVSGYLGVEPAALRELRRATNGTHH